MNKLMSEADAVPPYFAYKRRRLHKMATKYPAGSDAVQEPVNKRDALKKFIAERKKSTKKDNELKSVVHDPYEKSYQAKHLLRLPTVLYLMPDDAVLEHICSWDEDHPECPQRVGASIARCQQLGLFQRCTVVKCTELATVDDVKIAHSAELFEVLQKIPTLPEADAENIASNYDSIYFNKGTYKAALLALKASIRMVEAVAQGHFQNGFAFVRPPGHHAMRSEFCGYCYFNNVAIAVKNCLNKGLAKRVLIIDYDVHHGQGTQQMFYESNDVLYFSIHRYEHGTFWPNLRESNFDFIGANKGKGYNINVPLNEIGLDDDDYLAIVFHLLLPIAYEFKPDLIVISAGYDAAVGCPEGQMKVTPGFYGHLITLLSGLAKGKIAVILEGGYFIPSLAEGIAMTIKGLLGDPCAVLDPIQPPKSSVVDSINNLKTILMPYWNCFKSCRISDMEEPNLFVYHRYSLKYFGEPEGPPFHTRQAYPMIKRNHIEHLKLLLHSFRQKYGDLGQKPVVWCYDEAMLGHEAAGDVVEKPERISAIRDRFEEFGLIERLEKVDSTPDDVMMWISLLHDSEHVRNVLEGTVEQTSDIYANEFTGKAVRSAVGGLLNVIEKVLTGAATSGVAIIRPPGHHAGRSTAEGFCFLNNVAVGAKYIVSKYSKDRVVIVDFDVHHGNGTQQLVYGSKNILYISIHRHDHGKFYPSTKLGNVECIGEGIGEGYNINIPFDSGKMGNSEYFAVFHTIILPVLYSFAPDVILLSAGFDAGLNDPLGGYKVSPEMFGHFVQVLKPLACGRMILVLEGGYNITTTSYAATICTKVLLGDPIPLPDNMFKNVVLPCKKTIGKVIDVHRWNWPILNVNKVLPILDVLESLGHSSANSNNSN